MIIGREPQELLSVYVLTKLIYLIWILLRPTSPIVGANANHSTPCLNVGGAPPATGCGGIRYDLFTPVTCAIPRIVLPPYPCLF